MLAAGAAGAAASMVPPSVHAALARPMRTGGLAAMEHVVVLMQENRSFDHYFGALRGVRGFSDAHPLELPGGGPVFAQPRAGGSPVLPFSLREQAAREGREPGEIQYLDDLDHSWDGSGAAWARGWNDGWIPAKTPATMTYYDRADLALQYELADTFTVCDAYHCSVFGSTNPNRNYLWTGTTGIQPVTGGRAVGNDAYEYDHPGYDWPTYPEALEQAGVSWRIYQEWDNFTDNAVEFFVPFKRVASKALAAVDGEFRTAGEFYDVVAEADEPERRRLLGRLEAGLATLSPAERSLFDRAVYRSEPGTLVDRLRADVAAGTLPAVTWLVPPSTASEHPSASTPLESARLIHDVLDVLASHERTWERTALLINFDENENDGYFDHVPPPVPPSDGAGAGVGGGAGDEDRFAGRPIGFGPRVPMTIVSPWTVGGFVDSTVYDHTSVLRLLERWTGVEAAGISPWRRTVAGDLTNAFDFARQARPPRVSAPGPVPEPVPRWHPEVPDEQVMPTAEPGTRPARALPYQPSVSGRWADGTLAVRLRNTGSASAHFAIYPYAGELDEPAHHDVRGEHTVHLSPSGNDYRVVVQGPNRAWWELRGDAQGAAACVEVTSRALPRRLGMELTITNHGTARLTFRLRSRHHAPATRFVVVAAGRSVEVPWRTHRGWYDVEVTTEADPSFLRSLTARVENGQPGVSGG